MKCVAYVGTLLGVAYSVTAFGAELPDMGTESVPEDSYGRSANLTPTADGDKDSGKKPGGRAPAVEPFDPPKAPPPDPPKSGPDEPKK